MLQRVDTELNAMTEWSADGRTPSEEERGRIDIGRVAVREFADEDGLEEFCDNLYNLDSYFEDWPEDKAAANATDDDWHFRVD